MSHVALRQSIEMNCVLSFNCFTAVNLLPNFQIVLFVILKSKIKGRVVIKKIGLNQSFIAIS